MRYNRELLESGPSGLRPVGREGFFDIGVQIPLFNRNQGAVAAARADLTERERSEWARYKAAYNIDIDDLSPYHLVVDTTRWTAEVIVEALTAFARGLSAPIRTP